MKNIKFLRVIILLVFAIGLFSTSVIQANAASNPIKTETVYYKGNKNIAYPKLSGIKNTQIQHNINLFFRQVGKGHYDGYNALMNSMEENYDEEYCSEFPFSCQYRYKTTFKLAYQDSNYISVLVYTDMYTGGVHGGRFVQSYNFNIKTGKLVTIPDVVKPAKAQKTKQHIYNFLKKQDIMFDDITVKDIKLNKGTTFIFTNTGISVIYQEYELAPYAVGNPKANIPKSVYR